MFVLYIFQGIFILFRAHLNMLTRIFMSIKEFLLHIRQIFKEHKLRFNNKQFIRPIKGTN